ncbi:YoaK family protein [Streptomyces sp. NPDC086787]|uniref:YoaK family protein n=1 Tax=Streptomyces sp. NPDC086787 TaxID=3365759 RepID=UPI00380C6F26
MLSERQVLRLLVVLAAAAGSLDALCVSTLDGMFASVITGNVVQLGRALVAPDGRMVTGAVVAVGCYAVGVTSATAVLRHRDPGWRRRTGLVVAAETALLLAVSGGWLALAGRPGPGGTPLLLACAAMAMGVQSAATVGSGVPEASTTYLTGTLTSLARALGGLPHGFAVAAALRLTAFLCGAVAGALLLRFAPLWTPFLPTALVGGVAAATLASTRNRFASKRVK